MLYPGVLAYSAERCPHRGEALLRGGDPIGDHDRSSTTPTSAAWTTWPTQRSTSTRRWGSGRIYARMFFGLHASRARSRTSTRSRRRSPNVHHDPSPTEETAAALDSISRLIQRHHGAADGRIQVWPSPADRGLHHAGRDCWGRRTSRAATGTMLTIHVAESKFDAQQNGVSGVEYLASIGFLGADVLAGALRPARPQRHPHAEGARRQGGQQRRQQHVPGVGHRARRGDGARRGDRRHRDRRLQLQHERRACCPT